MKIIAKPLAGLANKLRVIESALSLGRDLDCPVDVVWVPDWQMVARYDQLFEPTELFRVIDQDKYRYGRSSFLMTGVKGQLSRLINKYYYGLDVVFNELDIRRQVRPGNWDIFSMVKDKVSYIDTCHNFYPYHYRFSWIRPISSIRDAVDIVGGAIRNNNCIGLHIRRTDNADSITHSPDHLFETAIREEISKDPGVVFFLATDDQRTQEHFVGLFGSDRILVHQKKFGRDSIPAIQDAVVDWLLLSKCRKLYCSFFSSFSETAAVVSDAPAITLKTLSEE